MHIPSPETDNCPSWISGRERLTTENISWSISTKECCRPRRGLNPRPPGLQSDDASNWVIEAGNHWLIDISETKLWKFWPIPYTTFDVGKTAFFLFFFFFFFFFFFRLTFHSKCEHYLWLIMPYQEKIVFFLYVLCFQISIVLHVLILRPFSIRIFSTDFT